MSRVLPFWIRKEEQATTNAEVNDSHSKMYVVGQDKEENNLEWVRTGYLKDGQLVSILELEELPEILEF